MFGNLHPLRLSPRGRSLRRAARPRSRKLRHRRASRREHRGDRRRLDLDGIHLRQPPPGAGDEPADQHARQVDELGAIEFGSGGLLRNHPPAADTLFPPLPVGPNASAMPTALDQQIHADNGATDYNAPSRSQTSITRAPTLASSSPTAATPSVPTAKGTSPTTCPPTSSASAGVSRPRRSGAPEKDRRRHRWALLPARRLQPAAVGDEQHRRRADLPDASAAVQRRTRPRARASRTASRSALLDQIDSDHPHLGQPARQIQALGPAPDRPQRPDRGCLASAEEAGQAEGLEADQHDLHRAQSLKPGKGKLHFAVQSDLDRLRRPPK